MGRTRGPAYQQLSAQTDSRRAEGRQALGTARNIGKTGTGHWTLLEIYGRQALDTGRNIGKKDTGH